MFDDLRSALSALAAAFSGVLLWIGKREVKRIDNLETAVGQCVKKEDFETRLAQWQEERRQMHDENRDTLSRIHERVDALWERDNGQR
jgi:hypothetical protein